MHEDVSGLVAALADRYLIGRQLGAGGMATVYLADDVKHHRQVAVKVLRSDLTATLGAERFLREIEIAARLQHPHILPLLDSGEAGGFLFYVMPYVEGESLRDKLARERELPVAEAVRILHDVVDALSYAHQHGVVHRDVKPENVLLSGRHAVVADFGIAKAVSDATGAHGLTTVGVALGTPAYMAPEQATADTSVDARADIYAVGAVAFELLTGRPPFQGLTPQAVLAAHVTRAPEPVTGLRPQVPPALAMLVMRCLEKRPADRWQRADEMLPVLEAALTPSGGMAPAATNVGSRVLGTRKRRVIAASSVALLAAVAIGAVALYRAQPRVEPPNLRVVVVPPDNRTGNAALDHLEVTSTYWLTRAIGATKMLEVVPAGTAQQMKVALEAKPADDSVGVPQRVAMGTGAGLVVSGSYVPAAGDSVRFELQLTDSKADRVLASIQPVTISTADMMSGLVALGNRVAAAVAQRVDPKSAFQAMSTPPSSYEAYRALADANLAAPNDWAETERLARKSLTVDSSYQSARVILSLALLNLSRWREADSILRIVESDQSSLSPLERVLAEWQRGAIDGDHAKMYRGAKRIAQIEPSMLALWILSFETIRDNRPAEALRILERVDPRSVEMENNTNYWGTKTDAQHLLGRHELELVSAREARDQYPGNLCTLYLEAIALAALKRTAQAEQRFQASVDLQPQPGCVSPGGLANVIALELRAHGDSAGSRRAGVWATHWYEALPDSQRVSSRRSYADALYAAERWSDALRVLDGLCRNTPSELDCLGLSGAIAARLGERDKAQQIADQISKLPFYPRNQEGRALLLRSKIAAALGNRESAVTLLREALNTGIIFSSALHRDPDLQLLRGFRAFDELLRPHG